MNIRYTLTPQAIAAGCVFEIPAPGDAGFDIYASEGATLGAQGDSKWVNAGWIPTGLHIEIPRGYVGIVKDRSSMAAAGVYTHAGVIDSGYRGEVKVYLENGTPIKYTVQPGQKIAQIVIVPYFARETVKVDVLGDTERGDKGFGSTGK